MKVKNVNPLERHIEKITLAVAAAATAYMVYAAIGFPVTVEKDNQQLDASAVEQKVADGVDRLRQAGDRNRDVAINVKVHDYIKDFQDQDQNPLGPTYLAAVPRYSLYQVAPESTQGVTQNEEKVLVIAPKVPAPTDLTAEAARGLVWDRVAGTPAAVPTGGAGAKTEETPKDWNWVKISAMYPMLKLQLEMAGADLRPENRVPPEAQRIDFHSVRVERQEQLPDGRWPSDSNWSMVRPVKWQLEALRPLNKTDLASGGRDPQYVKKVLDLVDSLYLDILQPMFYAQATAAAQFAPAATTQPKPKSVIDTSQTTAQRDRLNALRQSSPGGGRMPPGVPGMPPGMSLPPGVTLPPGAMLPPGASLPPGAYGSGGGRTSAPPPVPSLPPPVPSGGGGYTIPPMPPGVPMSPGVMPGQPTAPEARSLQALLAMDEVPIWFYDETVQPGHKYRYRMAVSIFNPLFQLQLPLKEMKLKSEPWLQSDWVTMSTDDAVLVPASRHLFVTKGLVDKSDYGTVKIYQWERGRYVAQEETLSAGREIGHSQIMADGTTVDFHTGYTVVEVKTDLRSNETRMILQTPSGDLTVRTSAADQDSPERQKLEENLHGTAPTTRPG
jgi:hypothetical protein